jgi:hypothetical protein
MSRLSTRESRVTTREFYRALLEIRPQLQRIDDAVSDLQRWARGEDGVDRQLKTLESRLNGVDQRHHGEDTRKRTLRAIFGIFQAIVYAVIALVSAWIGRNCN